MSILERRLREKVAALDPFISAKAPPEQREEQVLELCGWAHGELSSAASVVRYGQLAVADVAAVASAAEAIDEVT